MTINKKHLTYVSFTLCYITTFLGKDWQWLWIVAGVSFVIGSYLLGALIEPSEEEERR